MARVMKNSGVPWIGQIPVAWKVCPLKTSIKWKSEKNHADAMVLSLYRDYGIVPKDSRDDNFNVTSLDTSGYKYVEVGDLVINKMKAWQGSIAVSDYEGIVSPAYHVCQITNKSVFKRYLHYLLRNSSYLPEYMRLSTGLRIGQWDLGFDDFKNIPIILPDIDEQKRIVSFLDAECAHIDAVIEQTRASIDEYKKLKQAVITQAITKGVHPDYQMNDSGITGVGDIRADWAIQPLKTIAVIQRGGSPRPIEQYISEDDTGYNWIRIGDSVKGSKYINATLRKIIPEGLPKTRLIKKGSLILSNSMSFGQPYILGIDGCIHDGWVAFSEIRVNQEYLYYFLLSEMAMIQFQQQVAGGVVLNLNVDKIGSTRITIPDDSEQTDIVKHLDEKIQEIDILIEKKEQLVSEIESYKKSLIFEYVTGKKEVV